MAVRAVSAGVAGVPLNPLPVVDAPPFPGAADPADETRGAILQLVGRLAGNDHRAPVAEPPGATAEEMRALRMLAIDNFLDIVSLRESLAERDTQIASLTREAAKWRQRSISQTRAREAEVMAARRREQDLFSELHLALLEVQTLNEELSWRRLPWWRRHRARRSLASAAP